MLENIPSQSTMIEILGQSLFEVWQALCSAIDEKYDMERLWNTGGKNWTYEYKYRRGGKTLCCLYAKSNCIGFMIIFGKDERAKFEDIRDTLSDVVCRQYDEAKTYDTSDEIVYRVRKLRQRHDELVLQSEAGSLEEQAEKMAEKYPHVDAICMELQKKYAYSDDDYTVLAPQNIFEIIKEGRMLHHCVGNDGAGERYYDRMERRESFIMFLRRTEEPNDPYYTLEIEPDG